ncbi:MAG TPA: SIMPL domain-containing protein [Candidatus Dormibacteraeota bacterium]|nr:SIMPL domain-containing protein [Candidatus Dormibacteraeota bacterium]
MPSPIAKAALPVLALIASGLAIVAIVVASTRPPAVLVNAATTSSSAIGPAILTSGDATVSKKPDQAIIGMGIESQASTAAAAQSDLAAKAGGLITKIKSLGVVDKDLNTSGYWIGPMYSPGGQSVTGYRASEQLQVKWHNVDTTGKALDAVVQEGGATNVNVSFGLADPKAAQAEARSLAIADAKSKAQAMASAAGVKVGQVLRVSDLSSSGPIPIYRGAASAAAPTQVPVGEVTVQVTVEVDFAIA